jgi:DNA-directed RNA polymerase specialized sigma24 family protein
MAATAVLAQDESGEAAYDAVPGAAPAGSAASLGRWQHARIDDRAAFLAEHPECVVTPERWESLASEIDFRARDLDKHADEERHAEIVTDIRIGILECAVMFRSRDPETGEPIFDYLSQAKRYIVQHASHTVSSAIRRSRLAVRTVPLLGFAGAGDDARADLDEAGPGDPPDTSPDVGIADSVADRAADTAILHAVAARLTREQQITMELLVAGETRSEIAADRGIARQRVHEHIRAIRDAYLAVVPIVPAPPSGYCLPWS